MMRTHPDLHVTKIGLGPLNRRDHARTTSSTQDTSSCKSETLSNTRVGLRNGHSRPYWEATTNVAEGYPSRCILQRLAIFALQDEIAASVVVAVEPQLYAAERDRVQQKPPGSLDAWDCVIRALSHMWLRTKDHHEAALDSLNSALRLDPNYARALGLHSWLSLWHAHQGWSEGGLTSVIASATERARFAVTVDEGDAWARLALGFAEMFHREHESSVEELRAALDVNPNFALAHACLSQTLAYGGRGREAVEQIEKAMRLSPRDSFVYLFAGVRSFAHYMAGDYAEGLEWGRRAVRQSPEYAGYWRALHFRPLCSGTLKRLGPQW